MTESLCVDFCIVEHSVRTANRSDVYRYTHAPKQERRTIMPRHPMGINMGINFCYRAFCLGRLFYCTRAATVIDQLHCGHNKMIETAGRGNIADHFIVSSAPIDVGTWR